MNLTIAIQHGSNARNDDKITQLRIRLGMAGYGIYWAIMEMIMQSKTNTLPKDYDMIAYELRAPKSKIKQVVEKFGLFEFTEDGTGFFSKRLPSYNECKNEAGEFWQVEVANQTKAKKEKSSSCNVELSNQEQTKNPLCATCKLNMANQELKAKTPNPNAETKENKENKEEKERTKEKEENKEKKEDLQKRENIKEKKGGETNRITRFCPPTTEEVKNYVFEQGYNVDAERFVDFYKSKGWMIGKNKMKDWKAAVRTWDKSNESREEIPTHVGYSLHRSPLAIDTSKMNYSDEL